MKSKIISLVLMIITLVCCTACGGGKVQCSLVELQETRAVISVEETDGNATVLNCMDALTKTGKDFTYTITAGMVTVINGVENKADFSACWMLYTTDAEMSNTAWGVIEYEGTTLGSAIVGAESLTVKAGELYIWFYQEF